MPASQSLLIADSYSAKKDLTTLTVLPYGNIDIPGQWMKTNYVASSGQHFFKNVDSTIIAVGKFPQTKAPSYLKSYTDYENAYAFYKWDTDFFSNEQDFQISEIRMDEINCYILFNMNNEKFNSTFIFGLKNGFIYNLSVQTGNWPVEKKHSFLINLFKDN
ncbi:MAG: hypothetical protein GY839_06760 [candidate division Zixibacteria bacterium]|nr:hypothetical protein [candidate division Zixibacteria bacterium]